MTNNSLTTEHDPANSTAERQDYYARRGHTKAVEHALKFLEVLIQADPKNDELLKTYKDLCIEDAKLELKDAELRITSDKQASDTLIALCKLDAEIHSSQTKSLIEFNKALISNDPDFPIDTTTPFIKRLDFSSQDLSPKRITYLLNLIAGMKKPSF